ncbi:TonB-dependent receptor domain-containing protein [Sphingomonas sp. Sphisp140]|uniref:TonB-dependent receptor domain-containing protein n=1 Tax=unclassified Sphingomonas TaxID=196159 RepID=UPI0039B0AD5C
MFALTSPGLEASAPARGEGYAFPVDILSGPLDGALQDLARQTGIELLFDRAMLRGMRAPRLKGRMTIDTALRSLLGQTDLVHRRASTGAWVVERRPLPEAAPPEELAEPEILVVGRKTQNLDIRRRENDVQPYQVSTRPQIVNAHRNDLEQYFRSRVSANTQMFPSSYGQTGGTNSQIDLRGLGTDQTLILVDGRRLPGIPASSMGFTQPDLNSIPFHAIERIETLTGTAGGIYGFGALGGVVNVVLRRDLHGLELHGTTGISTRGDARRVNLEGGFAFSPDDGDTSVSIYVAHRWEEALLEGQRNYALAARKFVDTMLPGEFSGSGTRLFSNSINVFRLFSEEPLTFKPEYGGATIANHTYLPRGFSGSSADMVAALTRASGKTDLSLSDERNASDQGSTPTTSSAMFNLRHRFGSGIEAYFDVLLLRNEGRFDGQTSDGQVMFSPASPYNPFDNYIALTFPGPAAPQRYRINLASDRYTAGLIVPLPRRWSATAEATFGAVRYRSKGGTKGYFPYLGIVDDSSFNPFGDWDALQRDLAKLTLSSAAEQRSHSRYREQSLRLAGPVWRTAAGPTTLTLLLQNRIEDVPGFSIEYLADLYGPEPLYSDYASRTSVTRSLHGEIKAPLIAADAPIPLLKGLELQLAARYDDQRFRFSIEPDEPDSERRRARFRALAFTAGAKVLPFPWLMLRGSYANGQQPPPLDYLIEFSYTSGRYSLADPKRGNRWDLSDNGDYLARLSGNPDLKAIRANTWALGMVLNPAAERGPRLSFDYSRIRRTGDLVELYESVILAHEDAWPERVTRLPLTDADRALGYTGGLITMVDSRVMNAGTLDVESIDVKFDWILPLAGGTLRGYANGTWQMRNTRTEPFDTPENLVGYRGGPLRRRANGGAEWTIGRSLIGANLQYFSRYQVAPSQKLECCATGTVRLQGSRYVPAQTYVDIYASRRFSLPGLGKENAFSVDLGIVNLFDRRPPYDAVNAFYGNVQNYSPYGDPRRRRVEIGLNANF